MDLNRANVLETWSMTFCGNVKGPFEGDVLSASNRDMPARSRYKHLKRRVCGGDRSEMENRIPLLYEVIMKQEKKNRHSK